MCAALHGAGFQALLAGGSVRDLLMKRAPHDFDIATDATPDEVASLFPQALTVGRQFGVTILPFQVGDEAFQIEVATFREDLEYKDGRRPEGVKFSTAKADAQRRDFTVNALFMDPLTGVISDFVDGQKDIRSRILRTVGVPHERFNEDKLRLLRAVRFSAQLDFACCHREPCERSGFGQSRARSRRANEIIEVTEPREGLKAFNLNRPFKRRISRLGTVHS